ncbi:flagellar basal-body rod protein FlgG [Sporobacter termitidis DSM 10068]|uniref:Flagellar basal-body rod protein FlgG n=1 Tax=Sporobacter termitidis DSM 10068 TaxID=1123282 RepID=A0A1M5W710_9FIRM|nr:flagellar basal-body rod protein FlgF [Sporobacter termitidis]SHH83261.1 flagellar basal-body rod protein FlgG [Sporobacter termitidis DSM 10068]
MQSLYTAASGLSAQQTRLDTISANIANVNTPGYKSTRTDFKDALYTTMIDPVLADSAANNLLAGSGVLLGATNINMSEGTVSQTDLPLDFAIQGGGFFQVQADNGEILYTRSGAFNATIIDGGNYLVTPEGYFVLDADGNRITLPDNISSAQVSADGTITADGQSYGAIGLVSFQNPNGLSPAGNSCFRVTANSGQPVQDLTSGVTQGSLERSNVDLSEELTLLIRAQRAYSMASRALTTTDDMMGLADTMHS